MALNRKYSALPDLDTAPDIYETPDLTDDSSTIPTTTVRSPSENGFDDDDEDTPGISRSRLRIDQARSRFMPAQVDARDVDFSDRLDGKRKSYIASSRRQRMLEDGTEQLGDLSDEEDGEDLERKIARLKREIEETKEQYGKKKAESTTALLEHEDDLASLSQALDGMSLITGGATTGRTRVPRVAAPVASRGTSDLPVVADGVTYTVTYAPDYEQSHALAKTADFDRRLLLLEKAIGITAAAVPGLDGNRLPRAIIPTLETLQNQLVTLSEASTSSLDSISRRVRELTKDAELLEKSRKAAKEAQEDLERSGVSTAEPSENSEQVAKINALYGTLPTIENLAPLLPSLLDRLRSLRAIHADAATASETLDSIEKAQADMATDIKQWREGLDKIEGAMKDSDESMTTNMKVVEGWVKELEAKVAKLS
ncbi:Dynamitin-domain-containing protein [Xylariales sp. PMI_506]|nr:Dynamitin-domain-containing protein [Xylariales sp. PMI_506]